MTGPGPKVALVIAREALSINGARIAPGETFALPRIVLDRWVARGRVEPCPTTAPAHLPDTNRAAAPDQVRTRRGRGRPVGFDPADTPTPPPVDDGGAG